MNPGTTQASFSSKENDFGVHWKKFCESVQAAFTDIPWSVAIQYPKKALSRIPWRAACDVPWRAIFLKTLFYGAMVALDAAVLRVVPEQVVAPAACTIGFTLIFVGDCVLMGLTVMLLLYPWAVLVLAHCRGHLEAFGAKFAAYNLLGMSYLALFTLGIPALLQTRPMRVYLQHHLLLDLPCIEPWKRIHRPLFWYVLLVSLAVCAAALACLAVLMLGKAAYRSWRRLMIYQAHNWEDPPYPYEYYSIEGRLLPMYLPITFDYSGSDQSLGSGCSDVETPSGSRHAFPEGSSPLTPAADSSSAASSGSSSSSGLSSNLSAGVGGSPATPADMGLTTHAEPAGGPGAHDSARSMSDRERAESAGGRNGPKDYAPGDIEQGL